MNKVTILSLLACTILASSVFAQGRPVYGRENLESRVTDLEWKLEQTNRRLERLERDLLTPRPPQYEERVDVNCLLVDTGYAKTFLGAGRTKLEAEANARQSCGQSVHSSYCAGAVKCSSGIKEYGVRGHLCVVTDAGYSKTFKGEGKTAIEAEAKAKQACQSNVHSSYCGNVIARCESF